MKILDRYVVGMFLKNYLISFLVLVGLYIVLDMVFRFDEFMAMQPEAAGEKALGTLGIIWGIADYYFYQIFLFFAQLSGVIPVVAAAFTLMRLSRFNELCAVMTAGVPLWRVALPIVLAALALNGLVVLDQELIIPELIPKLTRKPQEAGLSIGMSKTVFPIWSMEDEDNRVLMASSYNAALACPAMETVNIIERDADLRPTSHISAEKAVWEPPNAEAPQGRWKLISAAHVTGLSGQMTTRPAPSYYQSSVTPDEILLYRSREFVNLLSTAKINQLLARPQKYGTADLWRVKHARMTGWLINLILVLLAIPCVLTREPGRLKAAALKCLLLTGAFLGTVFVCQEVASNPPGSAWAAHWPAVMAWLPVLVFGPLAALLVDRVKT